MASREENEAVAGLLRRSLAQNANAGGACLEPEVLAAYFEHSLEADEAKTCDAHLSRCARCREQLGAMARAEEAPEAHVRETQGRVAWLLDWRWLTAAAAVVVIFVTVWLTREPWKLAPPIQPANAPLVAANETGAPKPNSPTAEYDAKASPPKSGAREQALTDKLATANSAPVSSKKVPSSRTGTDDLAVAAPSKPVKEPQSQLADSSTAATESPRLEIEARDQKQSTLSAQRVRAGAAGHNFAAQQRQQNQASQSVTVATLARQQQSPSPQAGGSRRASDETRGQVEVGTGAGVGVSGEAAKVQAKPAPSPSAAPVSATGAVGGAAAASPGLDAETANKLKQDLPTDANARMGKDIAAELQTLEERSSEKVIVTPDPEVKWRIDTTGFVERSENGGATWKGQEIRATSALLAGSAPDEKTCWVVGRQGQVFVTKDAQNWKQVPPPAFVDLVSVSANDASSATVTASDGRRFSTRDRGKKWTERNPRRTNPQR